jgi:adenylyltransferase/sulfurtransferase
MDDRPLLQEKIRALRAELATLEDQLQELDNKELEAKTPAELPLRLDEYRRYGRQMILPGIGLPGSSTDLVLQQVLHEIGPSSSLASRRLSCFVLYAGQIKIKQARILVIGAGGLGCPFLLYLAGAGVGTYTVHARGLCRSDTYDCHNLTGHVTIVDADTVEMSNLHRQVLHSQSRVGMSKVESARLGIKR